MDYEEQWSSESLVMVQNIWNLKDSDVENLLKLKENVKDVNSPLNHPLEIARCYNDAYHNLKETEANFRRTASWRQEHHIDSLLDDFRPPALMQQYYPTCFLDGYDREGDPISIDRIGASDAWAVYRKYGLVEFRKYTLWIREQALRGAFARDYEDRNQRPPARCTVIFDLDGLCMRHLQAGLLGLVEEGIQFFQDHYMGMAKRILVVRAPVIFRIVWSIVQHFCSEQLKKMIIFSNHRTAQKTLDKYIDRAVLPPCLVGYDGRGRPGVGMCSNLEGGIMPEELIESADDVEQEDGHDDIGKTSLAQLKSQCTYETLSCDSWSTSSESSLKEEQKSMQANESYSHGNAVHRNKSEPVTVRSSLLLCGWYLEKDGSFEAIILG